MKKTTANNSLENRVLVLMPTGRDASLICSTLEKDNIKSLICPDISNLIENIKLGAGVILMAEEALKKESLDELSKTLEDQPVWSDIPVMLFAGNASNAERLSATVGTRFNVTIVERPIRIPMLISAVRGLLRARERQYQSRNLLNQLEESDRQKDLFLATLSHELRTPLNSILGWIQMLRSNSDKIDIHRGLEVIERNAKAQSEIVSDILFVSRVITGKLTLDFKPIDLTAVLQDAIEIVRPAIEDKEIDLHTFFDSNDIKIKGNGDRLKQVFWNILSNAIKFTPPHGKIEVYTSVKDKNIEIEIRDSGQGIDSDFLPFIFERFRQADSSYTRKVGGLGLGLAIVQYLVKMHGGEVTVQSEGIDQGTSFCVSLPILETSQTSVNEIDIKQSPKMNSYDLPEGTHILLVEDNLDSREMLKVLFSQYNFKTTAVGSAAEALSAIKQNKPHILISDIGMPDEDGYELIRKIRELPPEEGGLIPAIALTGYASVQDRDLALKAGYQEHFSKPIDIDKLVDIVKNLL